MYLPLLFFVFIWCTSFRKELIYAIYVMKISIVVIYVTKI